MFGALSAISGSWSRNLRAEPSTLVACRKRTGLQGFKVEGLWDDILRINPAAHFQRRIVNIAQHWGSFRKPSAKILATQIPRKEQGAHHIEKLMSRTLRLVSYSRTFGFRVWRSMFRV